MNKTIINARHHGPVAIIWGYSNAQPKIIRIVLPSATLSAQKMVAGLYPDARLASCKAIDVVGVNIQRLLAGIAVEFPLDMVDMGCCATFQRRVLHAQHAIPRGSVSTYALIASHLGIENGARAVGNALARNPFPLIIPCHRTICSNHTPGGYQGGLKMKLSLLALEGTGCDAAGRLQVNRLHYRR